MLPATRHKWTRPALTPASKLVLDLPTRRDGRLSWLRLPGNAPAGSRTRDLSITSPTLWPLQHWAIVSSDGDLWYIIIAVMIWMVDVFDSVAGGVKERQQQQQQQPARTRLLPVGSVQRQLSVRPRDRDGVGKVRPDASRTLRRHRHLHWLCGRRPGALRRALFRATVVRHSATRRHPSPAAGLP